MAVASGTKINVTLSKARTVEIDLTQRKQRKQRKITAFSDDRPVRLITRPAGEVMTIIGGDRDSKTAWFVVVRRDKPSVD